MKAVKMFQKILWLFMLFMLFQPLTLRAQESEAMPPEEKFSQQELAQMLAPVALYPDALLSQVLMASTYPLEVIEADRWVKENSSVKGERLDEALLEKDWDPSVKALCHFPTVLGLMSERITETTKIGNAFLAQEQEVMGMIQELRTKAYEQGNLKTNDQQKVVVEKETIIIEPAKPDVVYVPYYDSLYVYGPWWYPAYPPYYWGPGNVHIGASISFWPAFYFGYGVFSWSYFDWGHHTIFIDVRHRPRYVHAHTWNDHHGVWRHRPRHRRGVVYRDRHTAGRYGQTVQRQRHINRRSRGFEDFGGSGSRGSGEIKRHRSGGDHSGGRSVQRREIRSPKIEDGERRGSVRNRVRTETRRRSSGGNDTIFRGVESGRSESRSGDRGRSSRSGSGGFSSRGRSGGFGDGGYRGKSGAGRSDFEDGGRRGRGRR